jgi:hypothetical protein
MLHSDLISTGIAPYLLKRMVESSTSAPEDEVYVTIHELVRHTDEMYAGDVEQTVIRALADGHYVDLHLVLDAMAMIGVHGDLVEWAGCSMRHQATSTGENSAYPYKISGASSISHSPRQLVHYYRPEEIHMGLCKYEGAIVIGYEREYLPETARIIETAAAGMVEAARTADYDEVQRYWSLVKSEWRVRTVELSDEDTETMLQLTDGYGIEDPATWMMCTLRDKCSEIASTRIPS